MHEYVFQSVRLKKIRKQPEHHVDQVVCRLYLSKIPVWFRKTGKDGKVLSLIIRIAYIVQFGFLSLANPYTKHFISHLSFCQDLSSENQGWQMNKARTNFQMLCFKIISRHLGAKSSFSLFLQIQVC